LAESSDRQHNTGPGSDPVGCGRVSWFPAQVTSALFTRTFLSRSTSKPHLAAATGQNKNKSKNHNRNPQQFEHETSTDSPACAPPGAANIGTCRRNIAAAHEPEIRRSTRTHPPRWAHHLSAAEAAEIAEAGPPLPISIHRRMQRPAVLCSNRNRTWHALGRLGSRGWPRIGRGRGMPHLGIKTSHFISVGCRTVGRNRALKVYNRSPDLRPVGHSSVGMFQLSIWVSAAAP
jgi:hypothetical protein